MTDARRIPFLEEDEQRIASAAFWGMIVSITSIATSAISLATDGVATMPLIAVDPMAAAPLVQAVITILINAWLLQASLAFRKVAATDDGDQAHLLVGFRRLRAYFMIQVILILLTIVGGIVLVVVI